MSCLMENPRCKISLGNPWQKYVLFCDDFFKQNYYNSFARPGSSFARLKNCLHTYNYTVGQSMAAQDAEIDLLGTGVRISAVSTVTT